MSKPTNLTQQAQFRTALNKHMEQGRLHGLEDIEEIITSCGISTRGLKTFLHKQPGLSPCANGVWIRTKPLIGKEEEDTHEKGE